MSFFNSEINSTQLFYPQLFAVASLPAKPAFTVPAATAKTKPAGDTGAYPIYPPTVTPGGNQPNTNKMPVTVPAIVKKALPPEANTPVLVQLVLDKTVFDDLLSMLDNPVHS